MKKMINNQYIKKKYVYNMVIFVLGIILLCVGVGMIATGTSADKKSLDQGIYFGEAYVNEMVTSENIKNNPFVAYADITNEPIEFAYNSYDHYAFIYDETDLFIMRGSESNMAEISNKLKREGKFRVIGEVREVDPEVMDMAFETYQEFGLEDPMDRDAFDDYFRSAAIYQGYSTSGAAGTEILGVFALIAAFFLFVRGIPGFISFGIKMKKIPENVRESIAAELEDPRTVFIKGGKVFLTPNYLIYADRFFEAIPYTEMNWVYKYIYRLNFIPVFTCMYINTKSYGRKMVSMMSASDRVVREVSEHIYAHNPEVRFGYSRELHTYFNNLNRQQKRSA